MCSPKGKGMIRDALYTLSFYEVTLVATCTLEPTE